MSPPQRREVGIEIRRYFDTIGVHRLNGAFQIHRIPQDDRRHDQIQTTGTITLIFIAAIANFTETIEEHRSRQRIAAFALI